MNSTLYRMTAATQPVPIRLAGRYPSSVSVNAMLYVAGKKALVCHRLVGSSRTAWPDQARIHATSGGSPRSSGSVLLGCSADGQVMAIDSRTLRMLTTVHS